MTGNEYQELAMRTNDNKGNQRLKKALNLYTFDNSIDLGDLLNGCLGLSGEVGEFNDMIKKCIFHEKALDVEHAKKECGDIFWYLAIICESLRWDIDEIMQMNIDKLKARYPEGFSVERANNRKDGDL